MRDRDKADNLKWSIFASKQFQHPEDLEKLIKSYTLRQDLHSRIRRPRLAMLLLLF